jgi:sensor histidine kinase YesM
MPPVSSDKTTPKRRWALSFLWINLAVVVVLLMLIAENQFSGAGELLKVLCFTFICANVTGIVGVLVIGGFAGRFAGRKVPLVFIVGLGVVFLTALAGLLSHVLAMELRLLPPQRFWPAYFHSLRVAMPLAAMFGLGALVHGTMRERLQVMEKKLHEKELSEERTRKLAVEARLRSLESRIQPHFLFNTLNSISSLVAVNPARAEQIIGRLAALLRASLDTSNRSLIPLHEELAMVESYLDIERVRFGEKLHGSVAVPAELQNIPVPPMSVQSLVENAVKHGLTPQTTNGEIFVTAAAKNGSLHIEVRDTGPGFELGAVPPGHGLDNLVGRLEALFGANAHLNVLRRDGRSVVEMVVPSA